jgi:FixJ family two-component response regulator
LAEDGVNGLDAFAADPSRFAAVVLDERMPGIRGHELLKRMRTIRADVPAVVMSGFLDVVLEEDCVFVQKPYSPQTLLDALRTAIARRGTRAS